MQCVMRVQCVCVLCVVCCGWAVRVFVVVAVAVRARFFPSCPEEQSRVCRHNGRVSGDTGVLNVHAGAL